MLFGAEELAHEGDVEQRREGAVVQKDLKSDHTDVVVVVVVVGCVHMRHTHTRNNHF